MKKFSKLYLVLLLMLPISSFAKQIFIEVVNNTYSNCFFVDGFVSNGRIWELAGRIPRGGKGVVSLVHGFMSKQPKAEFIYMCGAKTVTFAANDTTGDDDILNLNAYFIRSDEGITANVVPLDDRMKKNKPILARVTITNTK